MRPVCTLNTSSACCRSAAHSASWPCVSACRTMRAHSPATACVRSRACTRVRVPMNWSMLRAIMGAMRPLASPVRLMSARTIWCTRSRSCRHWALFVRTDCTVSKSSAQLLATICRPSKTGLALLPEFMLPTMLPSSREASSPRCTTSSVTRLALERRRKSGVVSVLKPGVPLLFFSLLVPLLLPPSASTSVELEEVESPEEERRAESEGSARPAGGGGLRSRRAWRMAGIAGEYYE
ncbi:hypothetical protein FB451DRAFT_1226760, partial [Mycena latifolia]